MAMRAHLEDRSAPLGCVANTSGNLVAKVVRLQHWRFLFRSGGSLTTSATAIENCHTLFGAHWKNVGVNRSISRMGLLTWSMGV